MKKKRSAAEADPLIAIAGASGVGLFNAMGNPFYRGKYLMNALEREPVTVDEIREAIGAHGLNTTDANAAIVLQEDGSPGVFGAENKLQAAVPLQ